jgi:hypothetical protein
MPNGTSGLDVDDFESPEPNVSLMSDLEAVITTLQCEFHGRRCPKILNRKQEHAMESEPIQI